MGNNWVKFRLNGLDELSEALEQLPKALGDRILKRALTQAAEPVVEYAKSSASFVDRSGKLRDSIGVRPMKRKRYGSEVSIGPNAPHAHLVEFGTEAHRIDAAPGSVLRNVNTVFGMEVEHPGARPRPFFRPAWEVKGSTVLADLKVYVWNELAKAAKRLYQKASRLKLSKAEWGKLSGSD